MVLYRRLSSTQRQLMRSPIPTLVVPGPLPLYYHEGGRGGELCSNPSFPKRVSASGISATASGRLLFVPSEQRACVRASAHFFAPPPAPPAGGGGRRRRRPATNNTTTTAKEEGGGGGPPHHHQQQHGSPFLLFLSFFLLGFEATSFAAFVTKNTKPDSVACCFKM